MLINLIGMIYQVENENTNNLMLKNDMITLHWAVRHDSSKIVNFKYFLEYQNQKVKVKNDKPIEFQSSQMVYVHFNKKTINETIKEDGIKIIYKNTDLKKVKTDCFLRVPSCILLYKNNEIKIDSLVDDQETYHLYNVRFDEKYKICSDDALNLIGSLDETLLFLKDKARNFYSERKNEIGAIFSSLECYLTEDTEYETEPEEIEPAEKTVKQSKIAGIFMQLYSFLSFNKLFGNSTEDSVSESESENKNESENKDDLTQTTDENQDIKKQISSTNSNVKMVTKPQEDIPVNNVVEEIVSVETNVESNKRRNIIIIGLCSGGGVILFILLVFLYRKYKKINTTSNI